MLKKSTLREIKSSIERYVAILAIIALGVGFFSGLKVTKASMLSTCSTYLEETNFYDYQILTSYGIDDESVRIAKENASVAKAEAGIEQDVLVGEGTSESPSVVYKAMAVPKEVNTLSLKEGRLPAKDNECVVDDYGSPYKVGDTIKLSDNNDKDILDVFANKEYTVVGRATSPLYLDYQRGTTELGDGTIESFFYIPKTSFKMDYYTTLYIKLAGEDKFFGKGADDAIKNSRKEIKKLAKEINEARFEDAITTAQETLDEKKAEYEDGLAKFNKEKDAAYNKLGSAEQVIASNSKELASQKASLEANLNAILQGREQALAQLTAINGQIAQLEALGDSASDGEVAQLATLRGYQAQITEHLSTLATQAAQVRAGLNKIEEGSKQLEAGKAELSSNRKLADSEFAKARKELSEAKSKLDEAQVKIDDMKAGKSYLMTRDDNTGFSVFDENASIVDGIAKIFPLFFFLVAALVCMTTMTRMIDEHRTQIGILKALGYSNGAVLSKYLFYSGSAAFIGAVIGFFAGCKIFPAVIWNAYGMMYDFNPKIDYIFNWKLGLITLAAALLCSMGATWVSCASDFEVAPSELIRPKSPNAGKRILLERIPAIWNRISFLYKVSIRNTFRYKKRFFMMVLGVSGCTALLIAGMGINTTIKKVAAFQFEDVTKYDYTLIFNNEMDESARRDFIKFSDEETDGKTGDMLFLHEGRTKVELPTRTLDIVLVATDGKDVEKYIDLHDGKEHLDYPGEGEAIVCRELEQRDGIKVGDTITVKDGYRKMKVKVSGICDNYVQNYIYVTDQTYKAGFGKNAPIKTALVKAPSDATDDEIREASTALKKSDEVALASVNLDTIDMVDNMMKSLDAIVLVVILCAGLLAFIVLYNLTNINITERIREVATIKVLGFYDKETQQYVFRENYILTGIAALVGIPLGKILLDFVVSKICVNTIYFVPRITMLDYVISVVLTFVFAVVVNLAMRKRLRKVSMTESLKSIE